MCIYKYRDFLFKKSEVSENEINLKLLYQSTYTVYPCAIHKQLSIKLINEEKGIVKMSHKKRYTCDIFDYILSCNFGTNKARAMKLGLIMENHNLQMIR